MLMRVLFLACFYVVSGSAYGIAHDAPAEPGDEWNPVSAGTLTTWTAALCGKGNLVVQPFIFYNYTRGTFDAKNKYSSLKDGDSRYQLAEQMFMQYGITDSLEIDLQLLYQHNYVKQAGQKSYDGGLGDSSLFLRYCLLEEEKKLPHLTGIFQLKAPTGKYQKLDPDKLGADLMGAASGGGSYDLGLGLIVSKKYRPFVVHLDGVYNFPQERKVDTIKTEYGGYLNYDFGAEYFMSDHFNLMFECNGFLQADKRIDGQKSPATDIYSFITAAGIGWSNEKIQSLLGYQMTIAGSNTDANDSVFFTLVYTF